MPTPKRVKVIVYAGKNLKARKGDGDPLAWVVFGLGNNKRCTKQKRDRCPNWNEESEFVITDPKFPLKLTVKDKDGPLGQIILPLLELPYDEHGLKWVALEPHRKNPNPVGEVCIDCWVEDFYGSDEELPKKTGPSLNIRNVMGRLSAGHSLRRGISELKVDQLSIRSGSKSMKGSVSMEFLAMPTAKRRDLGDWSRQNDVLNGFQKTKPHTLIPNIEKSPSFRSSPANSPGKTHGMELATVKEVASPPEIDMITPNHGPIKGGTLVQVSGQHLGRSADDIITLRVGTSNCLATLEYISPNKLIFTTSPGEGLCPVILTSKSGGSCTSTCKFHYRRSEEAPVESQLPKDSLEPSKGMKEFRRRSMAEMESQDGSPLLTGDDTDYFDAERDFRNHSGSSSDEGDKLETSEVERLRSRVEVLERQNRDLQSYLDRLLLYLMERYPDALESKRMYRY